MQSKQTSFFSDLLESGHSFQADEILLKFQYKVLNTILLVMAIFTFIFAFLSSVGMNPLGVIQTIVNYFLVIGAVYLIIRLRGPKNLYLQTCYLLYAFAFVDFVSALMFVPHDEFRIIWFYMLVFAAYTTGGVRAGNIVSVISITTVLIINFFYELTNISQTGIISSVLGLIILSLFIRAHTKKIVDFEKAIIEQEYLMISQSRFAAMGEMMSMIAHQWRQPLSTTTLMITNERIKSMMEGKEPNEYDKILDHISDTMVYLSDTIDDFQTYFKPDKTAEEITASVLIERSLTFIEARKVLSKVQIHVKECEDDLLQTYANEVVQVLMNIINNAIDALVERKDEDRQIWIRTDCSDDKIVIRVEDNGGGIEKKILGKIFDPYFSEKSKNGTGLGLYMAKMIVEKHIGGVLQADNTSNGALFSITLPRVLPTSLSL